MPTLARHALLRPSQPSLPSLSLLVLFSLIRGTDWRKQKPCLASAAYHRPLAQKHPTPTPFGRYAFVDKEPLLQGAVEWLGRSCRPGSSSTPAPPPPTPPLLLSALYLPLRLGQPPSWPDCRSQPPPELSPGTRRATTPGPTQQSPATGQDSRSQT
ncbi:hypothetical protein GQ602_000150 [Ophiocordyceps camponoti-floridani]|uniref:Uncharacterized protein n=1 Tax=Ophiocordyceps camponoti-floridani TaxID=2030778 RepID=A0A8H4VFV5_9HYPO|nr:hypothetical protein GQ602_000150 [Ophiocordyceps camponoti-floridani]